MSNIAIRVEHLSKQYYIGSKQKSYRTFRDTLTDALVSPFRRAGKILRGQATGAAALDETIWALKDVSFEIKHGEVVGIIGRNGAGKSTLLKILSRITDPTEGFADIYGRVGSLLEVGAGFHSELTGRENVYLNGAILGMKRTEIDRKFDQIVSFAEVQKFIDTPVKHYSSGMYLRLAFSVAAHLEPEILIIDEVLAVGDAAFQKKCLGKMKGVAKEGRTVFFVSHNMAAIQALCSWAYLIDDGHVIYSGKPEQVIERYFEKGESIVNSVSLNERVDRGGNGAMRFTGVRLYDEERREISVVRTGNHLTIGLQYVQKVQKKCPAVIRIAFRNVLGQPLFMCLSRFSHKEFLELNDDGEILCNIPNLPLLPGHYSVSLWCKIGEIMADDLDIGFTVDVVDGDFFKTGRLQPNHGGDILVFHYWESVLGDVIK